MLIVDSIEKARPKFLGQAVTSSRLAENEEEEEEEEDENRNDELGLLSEQFAFNMNKLEKKKTGRPKKIRKRPKKAISAYTNFVMRNRRAIMDENPMLSFKDVAKKLGEMWRELSEKDRQVYIQEALKDKNRYETEKKDWKVPELDIKRKKPKGAPKNPLSAYTLFVVETRRQVSEENPHLSFGEIAVLVGEMWRNLSDGERRKYLERAEDEKTRYEIEMEKWNRKCKEEAEIAAEKADQRKRKRKEGPKNPKSAYTFYVMEARRELTKKCPQKSFGEVARMIAEKWKEMSSNERAKYEEQADEDKNRWKNQKLSMKVKEESNKRAKRFEAKVGKFREEGSKEETQQEKAQLKQVKKMKKQDGKQESGKLDSKEKSEKRKRSKEGSSSNGQATKKKIKVEKT